MRTLLTLILLLPVLTLTAQNEAKTILDKSAAKIKEWPAMEIAFTLTMENQAEDIREKHAGKAYMKGALYRIDVMDVINYYDGKNIYTYMPEVEEVNIKDPSEEAEEMLNPTQIFNIHNRGFKQNLVATTNGVAYIELYPEDLKKNYSKIGIWIKTAASEIQKVTTFGKDGTNLVIEVHSIKQPQPVPADNFFTFDAKQHPDVEVVDMR
ncbi:MAG: outer membrane lipoprotein carrier protein LolA [Culturomica sp.]|jgi:outer membrane lipoprotein-sorting protein|nr:outer membrane lipoprotein carrier protein LolA [Culturomica sp.]